MSFFVFIFRIIFLSAKILLLCFIFWCFLSNKFAIWTLLIFISFIFIFKKMLFYLHLFVYLIIDHEVLYFCWNNVNWKDETFAHNVFKVTILSISTILSFSILFFFIYLLISFLMKFLSIFEILIFIYPCFLIINSYNSEHEIPLNLLFIYSNFRILYKYL